MIMKSQGQVSLFTPVLIAGSLILLISFAIRSTFGLFQIPIAEDFFWARSEFSLAIAIQNLGWGIGAPIFGALGEKFGDRKNELVFIGQDMDEELIRRQFWSNFLASLHTRLKLKHQA